MIHLLNTGSIIMLLRGTALQQSRTVREKNLAEAASRIRQQCRKVTSEGYHVGLSAITLAELEFGLRASGRYAEKRPALHQVLLPFEQFTFDSVDCVHHYGQIRYELEKSGKTIGPLDLPNAAHALALNATLITHNTREFRRVPNLIAEDWA